MYKHSDASNSGFSNLFMKPILMDCLPCPDNVLGIQNNVTKDSQGYFIKWVFVCVLLLYIYLAYEHWCFDVTGQSYIMMMITTDSF